MEKEKTYALPPVWTGVEPEFQGPWLLKFLFTKSYTPSEFTELKETRPDVPRLPLRTLLFRRKLGLNKRSELRVSDENVALFQRGKPLVSVPRGRLHAAHFVRYGELYFVFSDQPIENAQRNDLLRLITSAQAVCFPYVYRAEQDFPDLFRL